MKALGVDLGGLHIRMAHQFLDDPDIDAVFEQVRGVAVAKCVTGDPFGQPGAKCRHPNGLLQPGGEDMVAAFTPAARIDAALFRREKVLPAQVAVTGTHLPGKPFRQPGLAESFGKRAARGKATTVPGEE